MCKYCDEYYAEKYPIRNNFADDNYCNFMADGNCEDCDGCSNEKNYFEVSYYDDCMSITHWREMKYYKNGMTVISGQNSERIHRNYCHYCGRKLTK